MRTLALSLALAVAAVSPALAEGTEKTYDYDWVFHYYMAYDNNLEGAGQPILEMLQEGITSERVVVLVSADFRDQDGMTRYVLTKDGQTSERLSEEGSAEEETLATELAWVRDGYKAERYALVFLDHGGALGEMSNDEHPAKRGGQNWLYPPEVATVLGDFRARVEGEVELMFYQQCGKGSLENYYAMRNAAKYVMGSQTVVGAPNYYYAKAIQAICEQPARSGRELAALFTQHETTNMFTTYTTLDCAQLRELPQRLDAVLEPLLAVETLSVEAVAKLRPCFTFPSGRPIELFFDAFHMLDALYAAHGLDAAPLDAFKTWVSNTLITGHRVTPRQNQGAETWCGFSIFLPTRAQRLAKYRDTYGIYGDTKLGAFHDHWLEAVTALRAQRSAPGK